MRFRYTFQKIVDLKGTEKTHAEWCLSQAIRKLREEESALAKLQASLDEVLSKLNASAANSTKISDLMLLQSYADHFADGIHKKLLDISEAQYDVQRKQEELNSKMLDEKIWNKAKEKAFNKFQIELLKKEQSQLDEMALVRFQKITV